MNNRFLISWMNPQDGKNHEEFETLDQCFTRAKILDHHHNYEIKIYVLVEEYSS